jgi:hypothetical protein
MTESLHIVCPHCHTTNRVKAVDQVKAPTVAVATNRCLPHTPRR